MKKKILFITHSSMGFGGSEKEFERMLKFFHEKNEYELYGLFPDGNQRKNYEVYFKEFGIYDMYFFPVTFSNIREYLGYLKKFFRQINQVRAFCKGKVFDLCFVNVSVLIWPSIYLWLSRNKLIFFIRETIQPKSVRYLIYKFLNKTGVYFIAISDTTKFDFIKATGNKNISTIYPSIEESDELFQSDQNNYSSLNKMLKSVLNYPELKIILVIGKICDRKNQMLLVQAVMREKSYFKNNIKIVFAGQKLDDKYSKEIDEIISSNSIDDIFIFLGEVNRAELNYLYTISDVMVLCSKSEGFPLVIAEAMNKELPIISTNVGGISEILKNNYNGLLIDLDSELLLNSIKKVFGSDNFRENLIKNALKTSQDHFDLKENLNKLLLISKSYL